MTLSRVEQAAHNNARWCNTMCRAHDASGEFHQAAWLTRHPAPRFYPNLVTLSEQHVVTQLADVHGLLAAALPGNWGVKDSFCALNLRALAFELLFEAGWLWRDPAQTPRHDPAGRIRWGRVHDGFELAKWEAAWSGNAANRSPRRHPRLFVPSLLTDPDIAFLVAYDDGKIVAGAVANRTDDVVGLSNVFSPPEENVSFWTGCVATAQDTFPGMALVGYEHGPALAAQAVGFELLQPLRVWVHPDRTAVTPPATATRARRHDGAKHRRSQPRRATPR